MFSTPLTDCSMGVATVRATVSDEAPGYDVEISIVVGTMSGYCATGSETMVASPLKTTKILSTAAKRGCPMKDRKRVVLGQRVSVRLNLGCGSCLKKKNR